MRKLVIAILFLLLLITPALAQSRGALNNIYVSWMEVVAGQTYTITLPFNSRDVWIQNGSDYPICVGLTGGTLSVECRSGGSTQDIVQIDANSELSLSDFVTDSITIGPMDATASPVSVVVTY